jgi:hypothetical protein
MDARPYPPGYEPVEPRQRGRGEPDERPKPNFRTLQEFCAEYRPLSYSVSGMLCAGSVYTLTATTGVGKTSWLVTDALAVASSRNDLLGREVAGGRVAFCTAENPTDLRTRLAVASFIFNIDQRAVGRNLIVSDNRVRPEEIYHHLAREAEQGPLAQIIVDTWQAYFDGRDSNLPTEAVNFTRRFRPLTLLPGEPTVIIAAHPVKNATKDNLIPYGGGSTLNEVDGNLCAWRAPSGDFMLGWQGKFRGTDFEPIPYRIDRLGSPDILNVKGAQVLMPILRSIAIEDVETREAAIARLDVAVLRAAADEPAGSLR